MLTCHDRVCATCYWWERMGPQLAAATRDPSCTAEIGTCQVHAPVVVSADGSFPVSVFPRTHQSRFCGDWRPSVGAPDGDGGERIVAFPLGGAANKIAA